MLKKDNFWNPFIVPNNTILLICIYRSVHQVYSKIAKFQCLKRKKVGLGNKNGSLLLR